MKKLIAALVLAVPLAGFAQTASDTKAAADKAAADTKAKTENAAKETKSAGEKAATETKAAGEKASSEASSTASSASAISRTCGSGRYFRRRSKDNGIVVVPGDQYIPLPRPASVQL